MPVNDQPITYRVTFILPDGSEHIVAVRPDEHLWDAAWHAGLRLPAMCHQGWCLSCAARKEGEGCVDQRESRTFYPQDAAAGVVLPCTGKACSDLRLRTGQARAVRQQRLEWGLPAPYANL